eukprot:415785_1
MASCSFENFQHTCVGITFTRCLTWFLETAKLAPVGTFRAHEILNVARTGLVKAGQNQIFTPMLLVIAKKPQEKKKDEIIKGPPVNHDKAFNGEAHLNETYN